MSQFIIQMHALAAWAEFNGFLGVARAAREVIRKETGLKSVLLVFLVFAFVGCEQPSTEPAKADAPDLVQPGNAADPAPADPVAPDENALFLVSAAGEWRAQASGANATWCVEQGNGFVCASMFTPTACNAVWPESQGYSMMGAGFMVDETGIALTVNVPDRAVTYSGGALHGNGFDWSLDAVDETHAVLTYGAGCSILFERE